MKKTLNFKKLFKRILFITLTIYLIYIFAKQQKVLNSYGSTQQYYAKEIETKKAYQTELQETKSNINSKEYIEKVAREKLEMYLPNEKVYVDKNK